MANFELLLEAERRGILPEEKRGLLNEARNRGLIPQLDSAPNPTVGAVVAPKPQPREIGFGEAMGRAAMENYTLPAEMLAMAGGGAGVLLDKAYNAITGSNQKNAQNYMFRLVDKTKEARDYWRVKNGTEKLTGAGEVGSTVGMLGSAINQILATGGTGVPFNGTLNLAKAAVQAGMPLQAAKIIGETALHEAAPAALGYALPQATGRSVDLIHEGVDADTARNAFVTNAIMNTATGALPVSAKGGLVKRAVTGAGLGVASGAAARAAESQVLGDEYSNLAQKTFGAKESGFDAGLGGILAAVLGKRAGLTTRADDAPTVDESANQSAPIEPPSVEDLISGFEQQIQEFGENSPEGVRAKAMLRRFKATGEYSEYKRQQPFSEAIIAGNRAGDAFVANDSNLAGRAEAEARIAYQQMTPEQRAEIGLPTDNAINSLERQAGMPVSNVEDAMTLVNLLKRRADGDLAEGRNIAPDYQGGLAAASGGVVNGDQRAVFMFGDQQFNPRYNVFGGVMYDEKGNVMGDLVDADGNVTKNVIIPPNKLEQYTASANSRLAQDFMARSSEPRMGVGEGTMAREKMPRRSTDRISGDKFGGETSFIADPYNPPARSPSGAVDVEQAPPTPRGLKQPRQTDTVDNQTGAGNRQPLLSGTVEGRTGTNVATVGKYFEQHTPEQVASMKAKAAKLDAQAAKLEATANKKSTKQADKAKALRQAEAIRKQSEAIKKDLVKGGDVRAGQEPRSGGKPLPSPDMENPSGSPTGRIVVDGIGRARNERTTYGADNSIEPQATVTRRTDTNAQQPIDNTGRSVVPVGEAKYEPVTRSIKEKGVDPTRQARVAAEQEESSFRDRVSRNIDALKSWLPDLGWATEGGHIIRDANGEVTGRTSWEPKNPDADYLRRSLGRSYNVIADSVQKAIDGKPLTKKQKGDVNALMDLHDALVSETEAINSGDKANDAYDNAILSDEAWHTILEKNASTDEILSDISRYYENEANANRESERVDNGTYRQAEEVAGQDTTRAQADIPESSRGETSQDREGERQPSESGAEQSGRTDLLGDNTQAKQAIADAERAKDEKRNSGNDNSADFKLTGSDRDADVAKANGAQDMFEQPELENRSARQGRVGEMMGSGEVVKTVTGRETTPFPELKWSNNRQATNTLKNVEAWLIENAIEEAKARRDKFNLLQFESINLKNISQSDKDGAEIYLFGDNIPPVYDKALKDIAVETPVESERLKELNKAEEEIYDLNLDPELTKARVRNKAKKMNDSGLINDATYNEVDRILKDRDMAPEDALDELRFAIESAIEKEKANQGGAAESEPIKNSPYTEALKGIEDVRAFGDNMTKPQVRNLMDNLFKMGVIDDADVADIDAMLKDRGTGADEALDELKRYVEINQKDENNLSNSRPNLYGGGTLSSNPFFDPALYRQLGKDIAAGGKFALKAVSKIAEAVASVFKYATKDSIFFTNLTKEFTDLVGSHKMKTDAYGSMFHVARRATFSAYGAKINALADRSKSEVFKKFMQNTYASVNDATGTRVGLDNAQDIAYTKFINQVARGLDSVMQKVSQRVYTENSLNTIADLVRNPSKITGNTEIHQTAKSVIKTLSDVYKYLREAGVDVGEVKDGYYPREFDLNKVLDNPQGFKQALEQAYKETGLSPKDAIAAADELFDALTIKEHSLFSKNGSKPEADFFKGRVFGKNVDNANHPLNKFLINDPSVSIPAYINRAVRRAEMSRWLKDNSQIVKDMYANGNKKPSDRMAELLKESKKPENQFGESPVNWQIMKLQMLEDGVQTEVIGDFAEYMKNEFGLRATGNSSASAFQSWMRTWVTSGLLEKATLSSLGEIIMPAIRSGNGMDGLRSISATMKFLIRKNAKDIQQLKELGEDLGILTASMNDVINANRWAGGDDIHVALSKNLSSFFKMAGLSQFTEATRAASLRVGQVFVRRMARDLVRQIGKGNQGNLAIRTLGELGVPPAKAKEFANWLVKAGDDGILTAADLRNAPPDMRELYSRALVKFDSQTIMRPNKSSRPQWAQDGMGALVFQLQSYNYSFFENVIKRGAGRVKEAANLKAQYTNMERFKLMTPALLMPALVMAQYVIGELRDALLGDPEKEKTTREKWMTAFSRGVPIAPIDPMFNAITGAKYNSTFAQVVAGAGLGGVARFADAGIGVISEKNSENTNAAERALSKRTYDLFIEPAASIGMSMAFSVAPTWGKVALAGGRQVVGSGKTRDKFVNATAGEKQSKGSRESDGLGDGLGSNSLGDGLGNGGLGNGL